MGFILGFMPDTDQNIKHLKTGSRDCKKICGKCVAHVIFQECFPCMRGAPQRGFSLAIFLISSRVSESSEGRPAPFFRDLYAQNSLNPFLCQRITVSGFTTTRTLFQSFQNLDKNTQKSRSLSLIFGRLFFCFIIASCWRRARFSMRRFLSRDSNKI